jgi:hypothetical protein
LIIVVWESVPMSVEEEVALAVPLELLLGVDEERRARAVLVHLHRVVDHELRGLERIDESRVPSHLGHRVAHRGQVHDRGNAREIL